MRLSGTKSSHLLYYFSGMRPWLHFIPVCDHQSVLNVIAIERKYPGFFQPIAEAGKKFSSAFLNVAAAKKYTAQLLRLFGGMFTAGSPSINGSSVCPFDVLVHTQNLADIHGLVDAWVGAPKSGLTVEGFAIWAAGQANSADIRYQALQSDGMLLRQSMEATSAAPVARACRCGACGFGLRNRHHFCGDASIGEGLPMGRRPARLKWGRSASQLTAATSRQFGFPGLQKRRCRNSNREAVAS